MNSRERVNAALNHEIPDRVPFDLGGHICSGIHAVESIKLRKKLGLEAKLPELIDPMMFVAAVEEDLRQKLGVDCVGIYTKGNLLGFRNENYKPWTLPDGSEVLIGGDFVYTTNPDGSVYSYPDGNTSLAPSVKMAKDGLYFDNITRQEDLDAKTVWDAREDYKDQYALYTEQDMKDIEAQVDHYWNNTEYALIGSFYGVGFGDALQLPGPRFNEPKGIRDFCDWMMYMILKPEYIKEFFELQLEIGLKNLKTLYEIAGDKLSAVYTTGADYGSQLGLQVSRDMFRELFMPFHKRANDWIHENTNWKIAMHTCGSIVDIMPDIIEAGFDALNPVQISAAGMDAQMLNEKFGDKIAFWGGGASPQGTLVTGTPEDVYEETKRNIEALGKGGGLIGGNIHNLQYNVPVDNFLALVQAIKDAKPEA